jgi:hypothetical protein
MWRLSKWNRDRNEMFIFAGMRYLLKEDDKRYYYLSGEQINVNSNEEFKKYIRLLNIS